MTEDERWAHLGVILIAVSGIETYLRSEHPDSKKERLVELINQAKINSNLKTELHTLRKYRNKWVHVEHPWEDHKLLKEPSVVMNELERWRSSLYALYASPFMKIHGSKTSKLS